MEVGVQHHAIVALPSGKIPVSHFTGCKVRAYGPSKVVTMDYSTGNLGCTRSPFVPDKPRRAKSSR